MPYIYLDATDTKNHYGRHQTGVIRDAYDRCKLFKRYRHRYLRGSIKGNIKVYEKYSPSHFVPYVTLKVSGDYSTATLSHEEVYFNKHDSSNTALLMVLFFENTKKNKTLYYLLSNFDVDISTRGKTRRVYDLKPYDKDQILSHLLEENDKLKTLLTFDISLSYTRRKGTKYNGDKISVKKLIKPPVNKPHLIKLIELVVPGGFVIYSHTALSDYEQTPACFIYENQVLMGRKSGTPYQISEIQGKKYNVIVYYDKDVKEPLLLEFDERSTSSSENNLYYIGKNDNKGFYFQKLETTAEELKAVSSSTSGSVYRILKSANYGVLTGLLNVVKTVIEGAIIYHLDKNNNDGEYKKESIIVESQLLTSEPAISKHKHKPTAEEQNKKPLLYYKDSTIQLVPNDSIIGRIKLSTLSNQKFAEITTYTLSDNHKEHLLIKITNDKEVKYYLHRFNKDGTKWRQLSLLELKDAGLNVSNLRGSGLSHLLDKLLKDSEHKNIKSLLDYISFGVNSIIILLDQKSSYYESDIKRLIPNEIPPIDLEGNRVFVNVDTIDIKRCVTYHNYKVYKHHVHEPGRAARIRSFPDQFHLRFYLDGNYITLYDSTPTTTPIYLTYSLNKDYIWVYYYGDRDPRPLLFCYNDQAYRPSSKKDYESKWVKVDKTVRCECESDGIDKELLSVLSEVVGFLNEVELKPINEFDKLKSGLILSYLYIVQTFNDKSVQVKVTHHKVDDFDAYKHEPKQEGYRLGLIKYENGMPKETGLSYDLNLNLKSVTEYFDFKTSKHPLLVELEFEGDNVPSNSIVHYYSIGFDDEKKWNRMERKSGHDKEFLDQLDELEQRERKKKQSLSKETLKRTQPSSDDSETQLNGDKTQPTLGQTPLQQPPSSNTDLKTIPSHEESSPSQVAETPGSNNHSQAKITDSGSLQTGSAEAVLTVDSVSHDNNSGMDPLGGPTTGKGTPKITPASSGPSETGSQAAKAEQPFPNQISHETSLSSPVSENGHSKGKSSGDRVSEPRPEVDRSSHIVSPQGATQGEEASGNASQEVQRNESGHQLGTQTVDEHLRIGLNGKQSEEQALAVTSSISTVQREAVVTHRTIENRPDSRGITNEKNTLIAKTMNRIKRSLEESKSEPNIPVIAGGAASGGVGITGSVVGYIAYVKYCKA